MTETNLPTNPASDATIDALRMSPNAIRSLAAARLTALIDGTAPPRPLGIPFRLGTRVVVQVREPRCQDSVHAGVALDLTPHIIGVLWGRYAHAGTTCTVGLRTREGVDVSLEAKVIACRHIDGVIHEIGVRFVEPVDPSSFIAGAHSLGGPADEGSGDRTPVPGRQRLAHAARELASAAERGDDWMDIAAKVREVAEVLDRSLPPEAA